MQAIVLTGLLNHYPAYHSDVGDCEAALQNFRRTASGVHDAVRHAEHFAKLVELQRDLLGIDGLAVPSRVISSLVNSIDRGAV